MDLKKKKKKTNKQTKSVKMQDKNMLLDNITLYQTDPLHSIINVIIILDTIFNVS